MVKKIAMRQAGGSVSVTIPKEIAERYQMSVGDTGYAVETDRGILITPFDPDFERAMKVYARGAKKFRNALRELAK